MSSGRYSKTVSKLGLGALALGIMAGATTAVTAYQGKFTLPYEVNWGGSTLPAGDYTFEITSKGFPYLIYIHGEKSEAIVGAASADTGVLSSTARLDLLDIADVHTIKTLEAPELGVTFVYSAPKEKHAAPKEVHHQVTPQTDAAPQLSTHKMSIAVIPSGR